MIKAMRMPATAPYLNEFAMLALTDHVFERIDFNSRSIVGLHYIMSEIESGKTICYAAFDDGRMIGYVFGSVLLHNFDVHIAFYRHVNTHKACELIIEKIKEELSVGYITASISVENKAAQLCFRKLGGRVAAIGGDGHRKNLNEYVDCYIMRKEL